MRTILLAEDDLSLRKALQELLCEAKINVITAADGATARQLFLSENVDLVLSDIRMPSLTGIELLQFVKKTSDTPVILMTAFSELCEAKDAAAMGAAGFLPKPFKKMELLELITEIFSTRLPKTDDEMNDVQHQFCKVHVDDFIAGKAMNFDIYLRINPQKYMKVAHGGEDLSNERIGSFKSKNLRFLYARKDDFSKYIGAHTTPPKGGVKPSKRLRERKLELLRMTGETIVKSIRFDGISSDAYEHITTYLENAIDILCEQESAAVVLESLKSHTDWLYTHSVGVCMISMLLAREMKWTSPQNLFKIALGGLLHDVGKKEIDRATLEKMRRECTPDELRLLESHTSRGHEILGRLGVPSEVLQIVGQHHENCVGGGYPRGVRKNLIHPLARLVAVADEFCKVTLPMPNSECLEPQEGIARMIQLQGDYLDDEFVKALQKLFKTKASKLAQT